MTQPVNEQNIFQRIVLGMPTPKAIAEAMVSTPPAASMSRRWGTISAINGNGTVDVNVGGIIIPGVRRMATYTPTIGETVALDVVAGDMVVSGTLPPSPLNDYHSRISATEVITQAMDDFAEGTYIETGNQSINSTTTTYIAFGTNNISNPYLTKAVIGGTGHQFTVTRAGVWSYASVCRFAAATAGGERYMALMVNGGIRSAQGQQVAANSGAVTLSCGVTERLAVNDVISMSVWQNSGSTLQLEASGGAWVNIRLAWVRP